MSIISHNIIVTHGPSLYAPFKAIIIDYSNSAIDESNHLSLGQIQKLSTVLPKIITSKLSVKGLDDVSKLLCLLSTTLHDARETLELEVKVQVLGDNKYRLIAEYYNEITTREVLQLSFDVISFIISQDIAPLQKFVKRNYQLVQNILNRSPGFIVQWIMLAAKKRKIPSFLVENDSLLTSYGQGKKSVFFENSSTEFDSKVGFLLQQDKVRTNSFLQKVGYPYTNQRMVQSFEYCHKTVENIGYPVVIKPVSEGQSIGVTANIHTSEQLKRAYDLAAKYSSGNVLVENHFVGDVYRITMSCNKIIGVGCSSLPQIIGDGKSTIKVLIDQENIRRMLPEMVSQLVIQIAIDTRLINSLQNADYDLDSIPKNGEKILLGDIHNRSFGGIHTMIEIEDMHPDYVEMVHDLAKLFRLDSIGIDIITPDISISWREIGTILEMNAHPGFVTDHLDRLLDNYFSDNDGRIDTTLVVSNDHKYSEKVFNKKH